MKALGILVIAAVLSLVGWTAYTNWDTVKASVVPAKPIPPPPCQGCTCGCKESGTCKCGDKCPCKCGCGKTGECECGKAKCSGCSY